MSEVQLSGRLPRQEVNGLSEQLEAFTAVPAPDPIVVVGVVVRDGRTTYDDGREAKAGAKFSQIEPLYGDDASRAVMLLNHARETRDGATPLDGFDMPDVVEFPRPVPASSPFGVPDDDGDAA